MIEFDGKRVMVVDDEETILKLLTKVLTKWGMEVVPFDNGESAWESFRLDPNYELIITDYTMPRMVGTKLVANIRTLDAAIPIIMFTGYSSEATAAIYKSGVTVILEKPASIIDMKQVLLSVFK